MKKPLETAVHLGYAVAALKNNVLRLYTQPDGGENWYEPAQCIAIQGEGLIKLRALLDEYIISQQPE